MAEGSTSDDKVPKEFEKYLKFSKKVKRPRENEAKAAKRAHIAAKYHASLTELSFEGRSMTSLKNFPTLLELSELNLADNCLEGELDELIDCTPELTSLDLSWNKFSEVSSLAPLTKLTKLEHLAVFECPLTAKDNYRAEIFKHLPDLKFLDGFDRDGNEVKKNNSNGTKNIETPTNSQEDPNTSHEDGNDTKIYKQFLEDKLSINEGSDEDDDEFDPDREETDESRSDSQSTSDVDSVDDVDASSEVSNSEVGGSDSDSDSGTHEPTSKRTRIEVTKSDETEAQ